LSSNNSKSKTCNNNNNSILNESAFSCVGLLGVGIFTPLGFKKYELSFQNVYSGKLYQSFF
jgi:hypothetical protein